MKKIFLIIGLVFCFASAFSQAITDTNTLRTRINADIVTNASKSISAIKVNRILNGILNCFPMQTIDSFYRKVGVDDTLYFRKNHIEYAVALTNESVPTDSSAYHTMVQLDSTHIIWCDLLGRCDTLVGVMGGGGGAATDTTNKFVNRLIKINDSTLRWCKGSSCTDIVLTGGIGGVGGSQTLNQTVVIDSVFDHTIIGRSPNGKDSLRIRDSLCYDFDQSQTTADLQHSGKITAVYQDEKSSIGANDPAGKPYAKMYDWFWWNNYNGGPSSTHRRGWGRTLMGYNMNDANGRILSGEAAFGMVLETDYGRTMEWYLHFENTLGVSWRPIMFRMWKDTTFSVLTFKSAYIQGQLLDTAAQYFYAENGRLTIENIPNRASPSSTSTIFTIKKGVKTVDFLCNGNALLIGGAAYYTFDNPVSPIVDGTTTLGGNTARWSKAYINNMVGAYKANTDANYTQLTNDQILNFAAITADRTLTLITTDIGTTLEVITGQNTFKITFAGKTVKNVNGTTATELPAGKSCKLVYDGTNYQVVNVGTVL